MVSIQEVDVLVEVPCRGDDLQGEGCHVANDIMYFLGSEFNAHL